MAKSTRARRPEGGERARRAALVAELEAAGRDHSSAVVMFHTALAHRLGLNPTDTKTLELLERHGLLSPGRLAELTGLAPASVTGVLQRLEARGFVTRTRDPADGRRQVVEVVRQRTPEIERQFDRLLADLRRVYERYTAAELEVILDFLHRVTDVQRAAGLALATDPGDA